MFNPKCKCLYNGCVLNLIYPNRNIFTPQLQTLPIQLHTINIRIERQCLFKREIRQQIEIQTRLTQNQQSLFETFNMVDDLTQIDDPCEVLTVGITLDIDDGGDIN